MYCIINADGMFYTGTPKRPWTRSLSEAREWPDTVQGLHHARIALGRLAIKRMLAHVYRLSIDDQSDKG
jgi:hypothetical protein